MDSTPTVNGGGGRYVQTPGDAAHASPRANANDVHDHHLDAPAGRAGRTEERGTNTGWETPGRRPKRESSRPGSHCVISHMVQGRRSLSCRVRTRVSRTSGRPLAGMPGDSVRRLTTDASASNRSRTSEAMLGCFSQPSHGVLAATTSRGAHASIIVAVIC